MLLQEQRKKGEQSAGRRKRGKKRNYGGTDPRVGRGEKKKTKLFWLVRGKGGGISR